MLVKTLKWPLISILITGSFHFAIEAIWPDLQTLFVASSIAPLVLAYGIWVGYKAIHNGGNYLNAIVAGAILGLLPLVLETFGFAMILFGSLVGGGFALGARSNGM